MYLAEGVKASDGYKENRNTLVVGSPGTGKTRGHVIPGIISGDSSMIVLDPKGEVYDMTADLMRIRGFRVQCIDFDTPWETSTFYNPLLHIRAGKNMGEDIIKLTSILTREQTIRGGDIFWSQAAQLLANSIISYLIEECNDEDITLKSVMKLIRQMDRGRDSVLHMLMMNLKQKKPDSFAVNQYELLMTCSDSEKTFSSIIISLVTTFSEIMSESICHLTKKNTIDFRTLGSEKTILYVKSSDTDRSKDILVSMFFQQAFDELCHYADEQKRHCLKEHVHVFMDDFGTNLRLEGFPNYIAGMRSREISCSVILQSESQLKNMFPVSWATIMASCKNYVFLGSNDLDTCREISYRINRPLQEVLYKEFDDIYVFIQGKRPQICKRYDLKRHKLYEQIHELE